MKSNIGVFGSCVSRDIFMSQHSDYKKYFNIGLDYQRSTIVSVMQPKFKYDLEDITILPHNNENDFGTLCLCNDFDKSFLDDPALNKLDFLIFDILFDILGGVLKTNNGRYISNNTLDLPRTNLYNKLDTEVVDVLTDFENYFRLWKSCFDEFLDNLTDRYPDMTIIYNQHNLAYNVLMKDSTVIQNDDFKSRFDKYNEYYRIFDEYIENKNLLVLKYNDETLAYENHVWGLQPFHYYKKYYVNRLNELVKIKENLKK